MDPAALDVLQAAFRAAAVAGASVAAGGAAFLLAVDRDAPRRPAMAGAVAGGLAHVVGVSPYAGLALLAAAALLRWAHPAARGAALALAAAALLSGVPGSHAAQGGPYPWLGGVFGGLHALAGGLWAGALPTLWAAAAREDSDARALGERFGAFAAWTVGAAVLSGLVLSFALLGSLANLTRTGYGRLLALKLALLAGALALAAWNRVRAVPAGDRRGLARNVAVETVLALGVLGAAGWLAATPTPAG